MLKSQLAKLAKGLLAEPIPGAPEADFAVAPLTGEEGAALLRFASDHRLRVLFWGSGSHQSMGHRVVPDLIISTGNLDRVVDWQAEDLTVVVQPGVLVADLEAQLQQRNQTAVLPETPGSATVGGTIAAGLSGWRRLRYGPTRDRMLEVTLATGDGRLVRGGGRLVKNVTGYDLPRLATGSLGSLGLIAEVCLKLWPLAPQQAMLYVDGAEKALRDAYRPRAVIETNTRTTVYLAGSTEEIEAQAARIGGELVGGHRWPPALAGSLELTLRLPAGKVVPFVELVKAHGWDFQAAHGVGEIRFAVGDADVGELPAVRHEAEAAGGALVVTKAPGDTDLDPWGTPPGSVGLQRRVKAAFDPIGIANPGRLPGRL